MRDQQPATRRPWRLAGFPVASVLAAAAMVAAAGAGSAAPGSAHWTQQREFSSPAYDFGAPVALSGDGNTALVAAQDWQAGEVFVYQRAGTVWKYQRALFEIGTRVTSFGEAMAISSDGKTVLISANSTDVGDVFVFQWNGTAWGQQELTASGPGSSSGIGGSIALSGDGTSALISGGNNAVYAFRWNGTAWNQVQVISGAGGGEVSMSRDGGTALIGTYVFTWTGTKWTPVQMLTDPSAASAGWFVGGPGALSGNGNSIMLAAGNNAGDGANVLFSKNGKLWTPHHLMPLAASNDSDYQTEALSDDGSVALVGVAGPETPQETVYMLVCTGTTCTQQKVVNKSNDASGSGTLFPGTVALSSDGTTALFGDGYQAAYVFTS